MARTRTDVQIVGLFETHLTVADLDASVRFYGELLGLELVPAASLYFRDPDGHLLEYVAMLDDAPRPGVGVVPYSAWIRIGSDT
jgi:lactoylglutathione lyase